jgi:hypothetical protein
MLSLDARPNIRPYYHPFMLTCPVQIITNICLRNVTLLPAKVQQVYDLKLVLVDQEFTAFLIMQRLWPWKDFFVLWFAGGNISQYLFMLLSSVHMDDVLGRHADLNPGPNTSATNDS